MYRRHVFKVDAVPIFPVLPIFPICHTPFPLYIANIFIKIGLELMVRCGCTRVVDVPITFQNRTAGESKLSMRQNFLYLRQLLGLYIYKLHLDKLGLVGILPLVVAAALFAARGAENI